VLSFILLAVPGARSHPLKLNELNQKLRTSLKDNLAVHEAQRPVGIRKMSDTYYDYLTDYYDDNGGGDDDFDLLGDLDVSPLCFLSFFSLLDDMEDLETPEPGLVLTNDDIGFALDFDADKDAVDAYASACVEAGGQYIVMDVDFSAACGEPDYLDLPLCLGALCDQDDIDSFGGIVAGTPDIPNCSVSTEVKSTDGSSGIAISASDACIESMTQIFFYETVYDNFDEAIVDEDTGEFTGDVEALGMFGDECESTGGRIVLGTMVFNDGCEEDGFSSVPMCVAVTCDNEEATSYIEFMYNLGLFEDDECGDVTVTLTEIESDSDTSSKSKKSKSKKAAKSAKGIKSTKATKSAKGEKSTKTPKHAKGEKSKKGQKSGKA